MHAGVSTLLCLLAGVSTLLCQLAGDYHIPGLKNYLKNLSRNCTVCQRAYARLLPSSRTTPAQPFSITGLDFVGPVTIRQGYTCRPVRVKAYILFVCLVTKAVHLELCADLTTVEFMAALHRFCARRGLPSHIHSDNGSNFQGAQGETRELQQLFSSKKMETLFPTSAPAREFFGTSFLLERLILADCGRRESRV